MEKNVTILSNSVITFNPTKIFRKNNKIFLFLINNAGIFEIDNPTASLLDFSEESYEFIYNNFKHIWPKEEFDNLLEQLTDNNILKIEENKEAISKPIDSKFNISSITLFIVQECNLRCTYCYGESGEYKNKGKMPLKIAKDAVKYLFEHSGNKKEISITFFGGEPLLDFSMIKKIVLYSKELEKEFCKKVTFSITTNGTLLTSEIEQFIKNHKFSVTLSIDGNKEVHDANRFFANKTGAYQEVVNRTESLRNSYKVNGRATVTNKGVDIVNTFEHLNTLKLNNIHMSPSVEMLDDDDYDLLIENYKKLINNFIKALDKKEYSKIRKMSNILTLLDKIHHGGSKLKNCGAGNNMVAVDIYGNLYPCHRFVINQEYIIGTIYNGLDQIKYNHIIRDMLLEENSTCNECWAKNICGGSCPQENLVMMNSIKKPYFNYCKLMKKLIEELIYLYMQLSDDDINLLFPKPNKEN